MPDFKFGDLICYKGIAPHDGPIMYVGLAPETSWAPGCITILDLASKWTWGELDEKDPSMWQPCDHFWADDE